MALSERLAILITANGAAAIKEFQRVGAAADKSLATAETRTARLGATLTRVGAGMTVFGAVTLAGMYKAAQAFAVEERAHLMLENTMARMPELAGANAQAFYDQASALQDVTKYGDEATVSAQAMLGTFHLTQQQILEATPLVQDYASKFGVDVVQASVQVGKAVQGMRATLQRNGIIIDENAYAADHFTATMDALRENAGGFAEQEGQTLTGQLERLKNNFGDVAEAVGGGAADAFGVLASPVEKLSQLLKGLDPATTRAIGATLTFSAAGVTAVGSLTLMAGALTRVSEGWALLTATGSRMWAAVANLIVPTQALTVANYELAASEVAVQAANPIAWAVALAAAIPPITAGIGQVADGIGRVTGLFRFSASINPFGGLGEGVQSYNGSNIAERIASDMAETGGAAQQAADAFDTLRGALDEYLAAAFDVPAAQRDLRSSFDDLFETWARGDASADVMAAGLQGIVESTSQLVQAQAQHGASAGEMIATVDLTHDRLLNARDAGLITAEQFREYNRVLQGILPAVDTAFNTPGLHEALSTTWTYHGRVYSIPRNWTTTFQANTGSAISSVDQLKARLDSAWASARGLSSALPGGSLGSRTGAILGAATRATGGPVSAGELALVGERGPELVVFGQSGTVVPAGPTQQLLSNSGGPDMIVVPVHIDGEKVAEVIARKDRRYNLARSGG